MPSTPICRSVLLALLLIAAGRSVGETADHWAYRPLGKVVVPSLEHQPWVRTPVDAFILAALRTHNRTPASEADKRTLLRRVFFNLTGLPPTPEEMSAFLTDDAPDAYDRVVDRLLASPRHGERWARHWMDAVHFAETHGHDQDRIRTNAWPFRDYLISSFNADKPYARFVQEQVAGDVLFPNDPPATTALGFLAAGPWDESSLRDIREDTLDRQIGRYLDRDDMVTTVMQTFTSTTVHCARCHDHKFDPITQKDYYALQAVFAGVDRANRVYDVEPSAHQRRRELSEIKRRVDRGDRKLLLSDATQRQVAQWEGNLNKVEWTQVEPQTFVSSSGTTLARTNGALLASGPRPPRDTYTISANPPLSNITAIRLELLTHDGLPHKGPGRQDNGNLQLTEFQLLLFEAGVTTPRDVALANPSADFEENGFLIAHALDGNEKTAWAIFPKVGQSHRAVFELKEPLLLTNGATLVFVLKQLYGEGHLIGHFRLSATSTLPLAHLGVLPAEMETLLPIEPGQRNTNQQAAIATFLLKDAIARELAALPKPSLVYAAASDFEPDGSLKPAGVPRPVHVLRRGEVTKPLEAAAPGALACVRSISPLFSLENPQDEGARRAALAQWLTDSRNPLVWRSIVNRVWHHHFSRGLVDTPNDFGRMGGSPSHPELLDWLAVWCRDEAHGSLKQLHRLIVTSAVYRQASAAADSKNRAPGPGLYDSENRLLWRMNRTRLDAEQVRDAVLQIAERIDLRVGGPSDMHFDVQPGIHVTPKVDYAKFDIDSTAGRRRGIYRFLFRTLPDPFMDALDCPAGDQLTPVRNASVTVQQALALWNNAFVARQAEHFAERLERDASGTEARVKLAFELALSRPPTEKETREFTAYAWEHGLANLCRVIFNSNEFMFVN